MIGENIVVTVMEVSGSTVRLGIAAPAGVSIYREEIWLAVEEENRAAAAASADALPSQAVAETSTEDGPQTSPEPVAQATVEESSSDSAAEP